MSRTAEHNSPQHGARVTGLDVFGSALRLDVEERVKAVKEGKAPPFLALDGLAGLVAAYIAFHHQHRLDLPSASLLIDTLWPSDVALVTYCRDAAEAPPPLTHALVQDNPDRVLPRYGLEEAPTAEKQSARALFSFRLLAATRLRDFSTHHVIAEGHLQAPGHRQHLVRVSATFFKALDRAKMERLEYTAVRPTPIAVWALEVLCALDKVPVSSYGVCMLLRLVYAFECESRISPVHVKEFWLNKRDWLEALRVIKANGELEVLKEGIVKLADSALLNKLAQWEVEIHGGDERRVRASYSRAMTMYGTLIKDTVAKLSRNGAEEHRDRLATRSAESAGPTTLSSSSLPHLGHPSSSAGPPSASLAHAERSSNDPYTPGPRDPYALPALQQAMQAAELVDHHPVPAAGTSPDARDAARERRRGRLNFSSVARRVLKRDGQDGESS
ncbi:hypothetical protein JCM8208_004112 [Rhodotorula glutinis]